MAFFFTISELYQNLRKGQKMVADIHRFLQNVRFWRVHQAQVPWGKGGIGRYRLLPCTFFFGIKKMIWEIVCYLRSIFFGSKRWYGMDCEKRCFCADARWWRARWPCALRLESKIDPGGRCIMELSKHNGNQAFGIWLNFFFKQL